MTALESECNTPLTLLGTAQRMLRCVSFCTRIRHSKLLHERKGSVAMMTAIMGPVLIMSLGMAVEVTSWSVSNLELQRIADASAWAGAARYGATGNAQTATTAAAELAEINGVSGATTRTWNAATLTMTDNLITAQLVAG